MAGKKEGKGILIKVKNARLELSKEKKKREKELYGMRVRYLEKAREIRRKNIEKEERRKKRRHYYYFKNKLKNAFRLWQSRVNESIKNFITGRKVPNVKPIEDVVVKEISKEYFVLSFEPEDVRLEKRAGFIDREIEELRKPIEKIENDVKANKKDIKKLLSPKIYYKTKELIKLEEKARKISKELDEIREGNHKNL